LDLSCWFNTGNIPNDERNDDGSYSKFVKANYDFWIDWGDGTPMEHYDNKSPKARSPFASCI
jgi:hypothetical protein